MFVWMVRMETTAITGFTTVINDLANIDANTTVQAVQLRLYDVLIPSIGAVAFLMNLGVVISSGLILKKGQDPRSTYLLLGNVAMADLITTISVVVGQLYPKNRRDHYVCAVQIGAIVSASLVSVFTVGIIAVDRYLYILHGLLYQKYMNSTRARICIVVSWLLACLLAFMPLFGWYGNTNNGKKCWFILLAPKELIIIIITTAGIPLLAVAVLYSIILYHAIRNVNKLQKSGKIKDKTGLRINMSQPEQQPPQKQGFKKMFMSKPSPKVQGPNKMKAIKVVLFTSGSFILTWGPYFVVSFLYVFCKDPEYCHSLSILIASPLAILGFLNTFINPIIYAWWHKGFRAFVKRSWNMVRKGSEDPLTSDASKSTSSGKISTDDESDVKLKSIKMKPDL